MLHRIHECLPGAGVLVVDDGSPDGTADLVQGGGRRAARRAPAVARRQVRARQRVPGRLRLGPRARLRRLRRDRRRLLARPGRAAVAGGAARRGLRRRRSARATSRAGSIPNWAWHRHLLSRGGNIYASAVLGLGVADSTAGYRAYSAGILRRLDLDRIRAEGYGFQIEMTYRAKPARRRHHRGADQLRRPRGGRVEDVLVHRGRGARPGDLVGPGPVRARRAALVVGPGRSAGDGPRRPAPAPDAGQRRPRPLRVTPTPRTRSGRHERATRRAAA